MSLPSVSIMLGTAQAIVIEQQKKIHVLEAEVRFLREQKTTGEMKNQLRFIAERLREAEELYDFQVKESEAMKARIQDLETRARVKAVLTFKRRVDQLWVVPSKSIDYTAHPDGTPYIYTPFEYEPAGLFPAVIVPRQHVGKVILIRGEDEH